MKTYLKEKVLKHVRLFVTILFLCFVYTFILMNGFIGISSPFKKGELTELEMKQSEKQITVDIPPAKNLIVEIEELDQKQETVTMLFYNQAKELVKEKDYILRVGYNNIGEVSENIACIKYKSNRNISIKHLYLSQGYYVNWKIMWYVTVGIFVLCIIQEIITIVKRKYAN